MRFMLALSLLALTSTAASAAPPEARSALLGSWAVDLTKLPMPPEARPKGVIIRFTMADDDKWITDVDIRGGDGSNRRMTSKVALDGTPASINGDLGEADAVAVKLPLPNVMVMELAKAGVPASTRVYTVTADGNHMIETAGYVGPDGKPLLRTNFFDRVR